MLTIGNSAKTAYSSRIGGMPFRLNGMIEHCCLYYTNSIQLMISQEPRKGLFQLFTDHQ